MAKTPQGQPLLGKTAIVCGGSKGIGRATAVLFARLGGSVCIVARGQEALDAAATAATVHLAPGAYVETIACDATCRETLGRELDGFVERRGIPDYLLNLVGTASPHYFEDLEIEDFERAMETNYMGQVVPIHVMLPHFLGAGRGHIATTSSVLGYMGLMGYATYAPSKYAVLGLTEVLRNELSHRGLSFSVLFPPDTDTPGFARENETKPREWFATDAAKLETPGAVAGEYVSGLLKGRFYIHAGQSKWLWRLARFAPGILHWYADRELAAARKKLGKA